MKRNLSSSHSHFPAVSPHLTEVQTATLSSEGGVVHLALLIPRPALHPETRVHNSQVRVPCVPAVLVACRAPVPALVRSRDLAAGAGGLLWR